jgi:hypothetical protein
MAARPDMQSEDGSSGGLAGNAQIINIFEINIL